MSDFLKSRAGAITDAADAVATIETRLAQLDALLTEAELACLTEAELAYAVRTYVVATKQTPKREERPAIRIEMSDLLVLKEAWEARLETAVTALGDLLGVERDDE